MLQQYDFDQHHRVYAWPASVSTVKVFYKFVDLFPVHASLDLTQQMPLWNQPLNIRYFHFSPLVWLPFYHLLYPILFFIAALTTLIYPFSILPNYCTFCSKKTGRSRAFFDSLKQGHFGPVFCCAFLVAQRPSASW